jgi:hypothetical protein
MMTGCTFRFHPQIFLIIVWVVSSQTAAAFDEFPHSSRVGPQRIPLTSYELVPIETVLAHPDRYQMKEIRLAGTVTAVQTEVITNRMICGFVHEQTLLRLEDGSGQIEVIDRGACGKNVSLLKAPMVKVGEQIDLLVYIRMTTNPESREAVLETTLRFLYRAQH